MDLLDIHRPPQTFVIFDPSCRTLLFVPSLGSSLCSCIACFSVFFLLSLFSDPPLRHSFPTVDLHLLLAPTDSRGSLPSLSLLVLCTFALSFSVLCLFL
jgi:hypothetical protein